VGVVEEGSIEVKLAKMEQRLNDIAHRVERLESAMYNDGVIARLKALEERVKQMSLVQKLVLTFTIGTFLGIIVTITALIR